MVDGQPLACSLVLRAVALGTGVGRDGGSLQLIAYYDRDPREFPPSVVAIQIPGSRADRRPPQKPQPTFAPLKDVDELRDLIQARLEYGDCEDAVAKLIEELSEQGEAKGNVATDTDVMTVFNRIAGAGGIRINVPTGEVPPPRFEGDKPVAGGRGLSWREYKRLPNNVDFIVTEKTWIYTMPAGYANGRPGTASGSHTSMGSPASTKCSTTSVNLCTKKPTWIKRRGR